ncbi:unnamed protein product [Pylaiella littoralis]
MKEEERISSDDDDSIHALAGAMNEEEHESSPAGSSSLTSSSLTSSSLTSSSSSSRGSSVSKKDDAPPVAVTPVAVAPAAVAHNKVGEQDFLREQLQKMVSKKLATLGGELDHAGLLALEALSKLPPPAEVKRAAAASGAAAVGGAKRVLPPGLEKVKKFSGKDPHGVTDTLNQFHSLVVSALPAASPGTINKALNRDVVFVLEGAALKFFNSLKAGEIEWEPIPVVPEAASGEGAQQQQQQHGSGGGKGIRPPSTWAELYEAFHDHYLPVAGIARTTEKLFSLSQAPGESVPSLAQRQLGLGQHVNRLIDANGGQTTFWEAITIRLFERALRADLRRLQEAEPPCSTFQESVDRAERNAQNIVGKKGDSGGINQGKQRDNSCGAVVAEGNGASSVVKDPVAVPAARDGVAASEDDGVLPKHVIKESHDDSERHGRGERSRSIGAGHPGRTAQKKGDDGGKRGEFSATTFANDLGQGAEDTSPDDRRPRAGSRRHIGPDGGGEVRHGNGGSGFAEDRSRSMPGNRNKRSRSRKRGRDWQENYNGGADQPFPPYQHLPDPADTPPCTNAQCKTINRQFHCSNECFFHPELGQRNRERAGRGRKNRPPPPPIWENPVGNNLPWGMPQYGEHGEEEFYY